MNDICKHDSYVVLNMFFINQWGVIDKKVQHVITAERNIYNAVNHTGDSGKPMGQLLRNPMNNERW